MKKRVENEDTKAFAAKFNVRKKSYKVSFFDFPASVQMRLAFKGMSYLLSTSRNPEEALEGMRQGFMPGDKRNIKYPLYITALARIMEITEEEAEKKTEGMSKEEKQKLYNSAPIKRQVYLLKAERVQDGNQDNEV